MEVEMHLCKPSLIATTLAVSCSILAFDPRPTLGQEPPVVRINREVGLAISGLVLDYHEYQSSLPHVLDRDVGVTPGFQAKISDMQTVAGVQDSFARLTYQLNAGGVNHRSQSLSGGTELNYEAGLSLNGITAEFGKGFRVSPSWILIPVIEAEYRNWNRTIIHAGLSPKEDYTFFAPGLALRTDYEITPLWVLVGKLGVEYTINPKNAGSANAQHDVPPANFNLGSQPLLQLSIGVDLAITKSTDLNLEVGYEHFGFGRSPSIDYVSYGKKRTEYEPTSVTEQVTLLLGVSWVY